MSTLDNCWCADTPSAMCPRHGKETRLESDRRQMFDALRQMGDMYGRAISDMASAIADMASAIVATGEHPGNLMDYSLIVTRVLAVARYVTEGEFSAAAVCAYTDQRRWGEI